MRITMVPLVLLALLTGCQKAYYQVWESLGKEKRHLLRDQVETVRDDQQEASQEFKDALAQLKAMYGYEGGELEKMYNRLSDTYEECVKRTDRLDDRMGNVQRIARDLFKEWQGEIEQINNPTFKANSAQKLKNTRARFARMEKAMLSARSRMTPVLDNLHDYVLYLKHNLNAQAIGSLKGEVTGIEADVQRLIAEIQRAVREADEFLEDFKNQEA